MYHGESLVNPAGGPAAGRYGMPLVWHITHVEGFVILLVECGNFQAVAYAVPLRGAPSKQWARNIPRPLRRAPELRASRSRPQ
jgi:hypothetical protein